MAFWAYFLDPVLRGPTVGCMLMCLTAALVGVVVFLKKQSLVGETLSHAAYPGVILGGFALAAFSFCAEDETLCAVIGMTGAFITSLIGLFTIHFLEKRFHIHPDAALCFVLSTFFGVGLTLASRFQFTSPLIYKNVQIYLYGQAATMHDMHIVIYGLFSLFVIACLYFYKKEVQTLIFDRSYAESLGMPVNFLDKLLFILIVTAVVIGIRSVGVVLMSAMLVAPAVSARQFTSKLGKMFLLSGLIGVVSGFLGNYLSVELSYIAFKGEGVKTALPTGPMIVLAASCICFLSLAFAPKNGAFVRYFRMAKFRFRALSENLLKAIARSGKNRPHSYLEIKHFHSVGSFYLQGLLFCLCRQGWLLKTKEGYCLTQEGKLRALKIIRLHKLFELYLANHLAGSKARVHKSLEQMQELITPEIEKELLQSLKGQDV